MSGYIGAMESAMCFTALRRAACRGVSGSLLIFRFRWPSESIMRVELFPAERRPMLRLPVKSGRWASLLNRCIATAPSTSLMRNPAESDSVNSENMPRLMWPPIGIMAVVSADARLFCAPTPRRKRLRCIEFCDWSIEAVSTSTTAVSRLSTRSPSRFFVFSLVPKRRQAWRSATMSDVSAER